MIHATGLHVEKQAGQLKEIEKIKQVESEAERDKMR
jgi:hypothetical protein